MGEEMKEDSKQRDYDEENNLIKQKKRKKIPLWIKISVLVFFIIISIHFTTYLAIYEKFNAKNSVNPKATSYFMNAAVIANIWMQGLHHYLNVDYHSSIMESLLKLTNYFLNKAKST